MSKKNTPAKTRKKTLFFVAMFVGFLGTGIFAGINVFAAYQKNQDFAQLDAEEKFSRLPEYLLTDRVLLKDKDFTVRGSAAKALGELQSQEAIPELISLLQKSDGFLDPGGHSAAKALGKLKAKEAIPQLISSIEKLDDIINHDGSSLVIALRELQAKEAIPQLIELLKDSDRSTRVAAAEALGELQAKAAIPQLTELLEHSDNPSRLSIPEVLLKLQSRKKFIDSLEYLYYGGHVQVRVITIGRSLQLMDGDTSLALGELKLKEPIFPLFEFLRNSDDIVYSNAEKTLIRSQAKKIVPQLIELLQHPDSSVRSSSAHVLGKLQAKESIPKLITALNDSTRVEQYKIVQALINLDGLSNSQLRKWMFQVIKDLEGFDVFSDSDRKSLAIDTATKIHLKFNKGSQSKSRSLSMYKSRHVRDIQWIFTGIVLTISILFLMTTLIWLRQLQRIGWQYHLICYFPEEVVGELVALRRELTQANKSKLLIETKLIYVVFTLIWAVYIQISIDNLWSPSKDQLRK